MGFGVVRKILKSGTGRPGIAGDRGPTAGPQLLPWRVELGVGFIILLTIANLRGVKEASTFFAVPTYLFVGTVGAMLVAGFVECADGACPTAVSSGTPLENEVGAVTAFLVLRAFASGSTALTGVEAIANGVQAFRHPKAHNAALTLGVMGAISISMFLGISTLARWFDVRISEDTLDEYGTVISQIGRSAFDGGVGFYLLQVFTASILILAANTAYQDFPRLSSILSRHRLLPRQYRNRGDRLVFSNGIVSLAVVASLLVILFDAQVSRLIQLYVVGVFVSFTLSQAGMVRHWLSSRGTRWRRSVVINSLGATTTGIVLVVVATMKFIHGAWIVISFIPLLVVVMLRIRQHYLTVAAQLKTIPTDPVTRSRRVLVLAAHLDGRTERSLQYARLLNPDDITIIHAETPDSDDLLYAWPKLHPHHPLEVLPSPSQPVSSRVIARVREERARHSGSTVTVILGNLTSRTLLAPITHRHSLAIKARLLLEPGVVVTEINVPPRSRRSRLPQIPLIELENEVLVTDMTRPIRAALSYATRSSGSTVAVHVDIDDTQRLRLEQDWESLDESPPLEILPSPYREVVEPVRAYIRDRRRQSHPGTIVNVVIPEFIVPGRIAQFLHNQTGLALKAALAREPGIAVTSVPFHLATELKAIKD
jgi:amino acid transporter